MKSLFTRCTHCDHFVFVDSEQPFQLCHHCGHQPDVGRLFCECLNCTRERLYAEIVGPAPQLYHDPLVSNTRGIS